MSKPPQNKRPMIKKSTYKPGAPNANAAAKPSRASEFEIFLVTSPGLEDVLYDEVRTKGFKLAKAVPGGVTIKGGWPEVWRANLWIRGTGRVIAGLDKFRVDHLTELEKRARRVRWADVLRPELPFRVEATCKQSRIYHTGAAAERIANAITAELGAKLSDDADITIRARIDDDICSIGIDTSGEMLHKRGHKEAVNAAPMRETMASLFLRQCGYDGKEPVLDPMCGSGTFVIEAAEIAAKLNPGRSRSFAFEKFANFDAAAWEKMRGARPGVTPEIRFYGSDRDAGAITMSKANAERAGVANICEFSQCNISDLMPPAGPPGLVIANPPYGTRIGDKKELQALYHTLGQTLKARFSGWRVGIITAEPTLAYLMALPFKPNTAPVAHGGLRVTLFQTDPLP